MHEAEGIWRAPAEARLRLPAARARWRGTRASVAAPCNGWQTIERRAPPANAGRHGARAPRGGIATGALHGAGRCNSAAEEPLHRRSCRTRWSRGRSPTPSWRPPTSSRTRSHPHRHAHAALLLPAAARTTALQIGSRSAITGADAATPGAPRSCSLDGHRAQVPAAARASSIDYSWWGWVDVSARHDAAHHAARCRQEDRVLRGGLRRQRRVVLDLGGQRLAERVAGK